MQYKKLGIVEPGQDEPSLVTEFKKLQNTIHTEGSFSIGTMPASKRKNRYADTLPCEQ